MKLMVASDIHGSELYCAQLIDAFEREQPDRLLLLGDLLYHGPRNEPPAGYAPKRVIALLNPLKNKLLCVRGNCEAEVDQMVLDFPVMADYAIVYWQDRIIFATHGHHFNPQTLPPLNAGDILLNGHTHVSAFEMMDCGAYYINPGSISIPKADTQRGYVVFQHDVQFKLLTGEVYRSEALRPQ